MRIKTITMVDGKVIMEIEKDVEVNPIPNPDPDPIPVPPVPVPPTPEPIPPGPYNSSITMPDLLYGDSKLIDNVTVREGTHYRCVLKLLKAYRRLKVGYVSYGQDYGDPAMKIYFPCQIKTTAGTLNSLSVDGTGLNEAVDIKSPSGAGNTIIAGTYVIEITGKVGISKGQLGVYVY